MSTSAFLGSLRSLPVGDREKLAAKYAAWNDETRVAADGRVGYLLKVSRNPPASLVAEEIEHGLEHTASHAFLHTLREWAETNVRGRLRSLTYSQHVDEAGTAAIAKFHSALSDTEQMLVLRAFAIEMMEAVGSMMEHGVTDRDCPVNWTLVNPATGQQVAGGLHAYFDGDSDDDSTFMPRLPA
jgi:hypothetical protein